MNVTALIVILGIVLLGVIIWWANHRAVRQPAGDGMQLIDRLRDSWHDWHDWRDRPRGPGPLGRNTQQPEGQQAAPAAPDPGQAGPAPARPPMPPPPASLPPAPDAPTGAPSAGGAQSDLLYAANALVAEASHGDIHAVRRVVATFAAVAGEFGGALGRLGTRLSEPDKRYGPENWEPVMQAGAQCKAAGIHLSEADTNMLSLINTTVGDLAHSPRQAPHHSQMDGGA